MNEAIEGLAGDDAARSALIGARRKLVAKIATPSIGLGCFARVLRMAGWVALGIGSAGLLLSIFVLSVFNADSAWWPLWFGASQFAFSLVIVGPVLLVYAAVWPGLANDYLEFRGWLVARGYRKIRNALTMDIGDDRTPESRVPSEMVG